MTVEHVTDSDLMDLIDDLRDEGYLLSLRHYVSVHDMLMFLYTAKNIGEFATLGQVLGPILCATPDEQHRFPALFDRWGERVVARIAREHPGAVDARPHTRGGTIREQSSDDDVETIKERAANFRTKLLIGGGLLMAILCGTVLVLLR